MKQQLSDDGFFVLDIDDIFNRYIKSIEKTWANDRNKTVGASEVFDCLRKVWFGKRGAEFGYEKDADYKERWGATARGNLIENHHVVPAFETCLPSGITLHYAGGEQFTLIKNKNSSTPDGLFAGLPRAPLRIIAGGNIVELPDFDADCLGLEIKSIDPRASLEEEKARHHGQSQVGLGLVRETTKFRPTHWLILYFDASFLDDMTPFLIEWDEGVYNAAKIRADAIWKHDSPMAFEPEGKFEKGCDYCMFRDACGEAILSEWAQTDKEPTSDPAVIEEVEPLATDFLAAKAKAEAANEELGLAKSRLTATLADLKKRSVKAPTFRVTWSAQKGNKVTDYKQLVEDHGLDTSAYERPGAGFDKLLVSPVTDKPVKEKKPKKEKKNV